MDDIWHALMNRYSGRLNNKFDNGNWNIQYLMTKDFQDGETDRSIGVPYWTNNEHNTGDHS